MLNSIKYNLAHLTDASGRDARQTFWFYMLFLFLVQFVVGMVASIPIYFQIFTSVFEAASSGNMDEGQLTADMVGGIVDTLKTQMWISAILTVITTGLFVASFVRRLHDAGFAGWIAAVPVATQLFSAYYMIVSFDLVVEITQEAMINPAAGNQMVAQFQAAPLSLIGYVGYIVVIVFGVLKSQDGPNKYGGEPVRF